MLNELLKLLEKGPDNALLRLSIASAYLKEDQIGQALQHLEKAVELDPRYSAAWKLYGKTLLQQGEVGQADRSWSMALKWQQRKVIFRRLRRWKCFSSVCIKVYNPISSGGLLHSVSNGRLQ